jgi:DNA-binding MarR family transcriptional regulator
VDRAAPKAADQARPLNEPEFAAWRSFLRAHSRLIRELDQRMRDEHDFTLGDFDVLVQLAEANGGSLRMFDLAEAVVLSPSGLSRRVDRLERAGLVARERAAEDARSIEARLTPEGKGLVAKLRRTHRAEVKRCFNDRLSAAELDAIGEAFGRLAYPPAEAG